MEAVGLKIKEFMQRISDFFSVYGVTTAVIAVVLAVCIYTGFSVAGNISKDKETYYIVMMSEEYIGMLYSPMLKDNINKELPDFGKFDISSYSDPFTAVPDAVDGSNNAGRTLMTEFNQVLAKVAAGKVDLVIVDDMILKRMTAENMLAPMQDHLDMWNPDTADDNNKIDDSMKRHARGTDGEMQLYGLDLTGNPVFHLSDREEVQFIACIPYNSTKSERTEGFFKSVLSLSNKPQPSGQRSPE